MTRLFLLLVLPFTLLAVPISGQVKIEHTKTTGEELSVFQYFRQLLATSEYLRHSQSENCNTYHHTYEDRRTKATVCVFLDLHTGARYLYVAGGRFYNAGMAVSVLHEGLPISFTAAVFRDDPTLVTLPLRYPGEYAVVMTYLDFPDRVLSSYTARFTISEGIGDV